MRPLDWKLDTWTDNSTWQRQVEKCSLYLFTDCTEVLSDKVLFTTQLVASKPLNLYTSEIHSRETPKDHMPNMPLPPSAAYSTRHTCCRGRNCAQPGGVLLRMFLRSGWCCVGAGWLPHRWHHTDAVYWPQQEGSIGVGGPKGVNSGRTWVLQQNRYHQKYKHVMHLKKKKKLKKNLIKLKVGAKENEN